MRIKRKFKLKLMKMRKSLRWGFVWHVRWGWINSNELHREGKEDRRVGKQEAVQQGERGSLRQLGDCLRGTCALLIWFRLQIYMSVPRAASGGGAWGATVSLSDSSSLSLPLSLLYSLFPCLSGCHFDPIRLCAVPRVIQTLSPICATWALKPQINSHTG